MKAIHKFSAWDMFEEVAQWASFEYRKKYAEAPSFGLNSSELFRVWNRLGRPPVSGGKTEPVHFTTLTMGGITTIFADEECQNSEYSLDTPDE